jgi:hypothetical protein
MGCQQSTRPATHDAKKNILVDTKVPLQTKRCPNGEEQERSGARWQWSLPDDENGKLVSAKRNIMACWFLDLPNPGMGTSSATRSAIAI